MFKLVYIKWNLRDGDLNEYRNFWHFFLRWTPSLRVRAHMTQNWGASAGLNISPMTPCTFRSTPTMPRSQFDSPAFNNTPYRQPSANPYSFGMSAAHPPAVHFPSTPQFQAVQTSRAYSYTPHPSALPYQSPPNFTFTPYNSSGSHRYNTDLQLEMSPIIVPSQYRDNVPTDSPDTRGDQDIHNGIVDSRLPHNPNSN